MATLSQSATQTASMRSSTDQGSKGLAALFLHGVKDIYYAEKKLTKALPKMIKAAKSQDLIDALTSHLGETEEHVRKVEQVFSHLGLEPSATKCDAIDGIVEEAESILEDFGDTPACDAAIIFAGQAAEHYEITRYGSLRTFGEVLKYDEINKILSEILEQEKDADEKLTEIAEDRVDYAAAQKEAVGSKSESDEEENDGKINWRFWQ